MAFLKSVRLLSAVLAAGLLTFAGCGIGDTAQGGTESGNARITGRIYQREGKIPATGVSVVIRPRRSLADTAGSGAMSGPQGVDSVFTDQTGRFVFDSTLSPGIYMIEAVSGGDAVLIDFVVVKEGEPTLNLPSYSLKPAGALKGLIGLSEGDDPRKALVLVYGIDRLARVQTDGSFTIVNLAEGVYDLRILPSFDDYDIFDTTDVFVLSGDTCDMGTLKPQFNGIPLVKNFAVSYDTLTRVVTLKWDAADTSLVSGYYIYRGYADSGESIGRIAQVNVSPPNAAEYRDSSTQSEFTYEYKITAIDKQGNEGKLGNGVSVKAVGAYELVRSINSTPDARGTISDIVIAGNSIFACGVNGAIEMIDTAGNSVKFIGKTGSDSLIGPTAFTIHENAIYVADLEVYNSSGTGSKHIQTSIKCFDLSGNFIKKIPFPFQFVISGIVVRSESEIFTAVHAFDPSSRMLRINSNGEVLDSTSILSPSISKFLLNDSMLAVSRSWFDSGQVLWFNFDMDSIGSKTVKGQGASNSFQNMAFDGNDNLYAAVNDAVSQSRPAHYINVFDTQGNLLTWISCENSIGGIAVDSLQLVYVGVGTEILVYKNRVGSLEKHLSSGR